VSAQAVRDAFRTELAAVAGTIGAPFYDTINTENQIDDSVWYTMQAFSDFIEAQCLGRFKNVETGTIDIIVMATAGRGDSTALTVAGALLEHFKQWSSGAVEVVGVLPIGDVVSGDAESRYYGVIFSIEYSYRF